MSDASVYRQKAEMFEQRADNAADPWLFMTGLCIAQTGMMCMLPTFWTLPTAFLGGTAAAGGIAAAPRREADDLREGDFMGRIGALAAFVALFALPAPASAQDYPNRMIKMLQGFPPSGNVDAVARMVSLHLKLTRPLERADAYDALAVAICHVHSQRLPKTAGRGAAMAKFADRLSPSVVRA